MILIKDMEMPTRCFSCPMCDVENAEVNCAISHGSYIEYREVDPNVAIQERPSWCPIVELPPHGRLIDEDALISKINYTDDFYETPFVDWDDILEAPTVIPADKDGET